MVFPVRNIVGGKSEPTITNILFFQLQTKSTATPERDEAERVLLAGQGVYTKI
jgi:hypothetical protein